MQTRIPTHKFKQPVLALIVKEHANSQRRYCRRLTNGGCAAHSVIMRNWRHLLLAAIRSLGFVVYNNRERYLGRRGLGSVQLWYSRLILVLHFSANY